MRSTRDFDDDDDDDDDDDGDDDNVDGGRGFFVLTRRQMRARTFLVILY